MSFRQSEVKYTLHIAMEHLKPGTLVLGAWDVTVATKPKGVDQHVPYQETREAQGNQGKDGESKRVSAVWQGAWRKSGAAS